jgi:hypothetical protein
MAEESVKRCCAEAKERTLAVISEPHTPSGSSSKIARLGPLASAQSVSLTWREELHLLLRRQQAADASSQSANALAKQVEKKGDRNEGFFRGLF